MNENTKQAYLDKMNAQLTEWGATIEVMKAKVAKTSAGVRIDYHTQLETWQQKEPELKKKLEELRTAGADKFESVKSGAQNIWNEMNALIQSLGEKRN